MTLLQFMVGSLIALLLWTTGIMSKPNLTKETVKAVIPLAIVHTLGNLLTNISLGSVAVSFTHTIKAMEPFFSVVLSSLFLGDHPSISVIVCLILIVGGVALASASEASFSWVGFTSAMVRGCLFSS